MTLASISVPRGPCSDRHRHPLKDQCLHSNGIGQLTNSGSLTGIRTHVTLSPSMASIGEQTPHPKVFVPMRFGIFDHLERATTATSPSSMTSVQLVAQADEAGTYGIKRPNIAIHHILPAETGLDRAIRAWNPSSKRPAPSSSDRISSRTVPFKPAPSRYGSRRRS